LTGLTLTEAASVLDPPMPRRELARRMRGVCPVGSTYGRRGRRAAAYPVAEIMRAHAAWVGRTAADLATPV
jgi:hypothetical protein